MDRESLIESAKGLKEPSKQSTEAFERKLDVIGPELNRRMLSRPDIERLIGHDNQEMMKNNTHNFLRFMTALFYGYEPVVFAETALWAFRTYRAHGFEVPYWPANLDTLVRIIKTELPETAYEELYPFFDWLIIHIPAFTTITDRIEGGEEGSNVHEG